MPFPSGRRALFLGAFVGGSVIYIYALCCPETGATRYIGKTKNIKTRLMAHISKAKTAVTNHHCAHWIRALLAKGLQPEIVVVAEIPLGGDWQSIEAEAIKTYRAAGYDLTNSTGGGDGFHDCSPELLKRRGQSRSLTLSDPIKRAAFATVTAAARANRTVRSKQSAGVKAAWQDHNKKARMLDGMHATEARSRRSEATRRRMHDPDIAKDHAAKMKALFRDPARRAQLLKAGAKRWAQYRARTQQQVS
jgi:hypothetical protein